MKGMRHLLLTSGCTALLCLAACDAGKDAPDTPQSNIPVGFSGDVPATRVLQEYTSASDLSSIGVFAYFTHGSFSASSATPNFMYNQEVTRQSPGGSWTYSPEKYWPNNESDKLSFFAYAPYVDETATGAALTFKDKTTAGYPVLTYTVPTTEAAQIDLLASVPLIDQTYTNTSGTVKFQLNHALTKVTIKIKNGESHTTKAVTSLALSAPAGGSLTYRVPASTGETPCVWSNLSANTSFTATLTGAPISVEDTETTLATFYQIPVGNPSSVSLSLSYTVTRKNGTDNVTVTKQNISLPATSAWNPGASVGYTLNISGTRLTIESATEISWTEGGKTEGELN